MLGTILECSVFTLFKATKYLGDDFELTVPFEGATESSVTFCLWQKIRACSLIACDFALMDCTEIA